MNYEIIAQIFFPVSLLGMGVIIFRKIPVLITLPEIAKKESFIFRLKQRFRTTFSSKNFSYELFLQKMVHKIRILTLKADTKTFHWLKKLRERDRKKKTAETDNYWEEVRKKTR